MVSRGAGGSQTLPYAGMMIVCRPPYSVTVSNQKDHHANDDLYTVLEKVDN